jgi:hypothetical protein
VDAQTLGDGQHDLPMSDRQTDIFGNMQRGQQRAFLVARGAGATLLAGEGDEHLVLAEIYRIGYHQKRNAEASRCPIRTRIANYLEMGINPDSIKCIDQKPKLHKRK